MKLHYFFFMASLIIASFVFLPLAFSADETITISTYYPAPYGVYKNLRFYPTTSAPACDSNQEGVTYFNSTVHQLKVCRNNVATGAYEWQNLGSYWTLANANLTTSDNSWNVGIGTVTPQSKLEVNGGIKIGAAGTCGDNTLGCDSARAGTMRYCSGQMEYCNGNTWGTYLANLQAVTLMRYENATKGITIMSYIGNNPGAVSDIASLEYQANGPGAWSSHKIFGLRCKSENGWIMGSCARAASGSDNDAFVFNNTFWGDTQDSSQNKNMLYVTCLKMQ